MNMHLFTETLTAHRLCRKKSSHCWLAITLTYMNQFW